MHSLRLSEKGHQNQEREHKISETGLKEGERGAGYPQILHKTAYIWRKHITKLTLPYKRNNGVSMEEWMHAELIAQVQELVPAGTTDPAEVQHLLKHHVPHYKCTDNPPNPNDSAYYPTLDDIQNHISKAKSEMLA